MAITHVKGEFFAPEHADQHRAFGFQGSAPTDGPSPRAARRPLPGPMGSGADPQMAGQGMAHPHGHKDIVRTQSNANGTFVQHHAHGGMTVHHPDGRVTHHTFDGAPCYAGGGGIESAHDSSEYAHGGKAMTAAEDKRQDAKMIRKMMAEHETSEGEGEGRQKLARGGRAMIPRAIVPVAARRHSPIEIPPRNPQTTTTPRNAMPGGVQPYGVQPSDEPGALNAGAPPGLKRGGRVRRAAGGGVDDSDMNFGTISNEPVGARFSRVVFGGGKGSAPAAAPERDWSAPSADWSPAPGTADESDSTRSFKPPSASDYEGERARPFSASPSSEPRMLRTATLIKSPIQRKRRPVAAPSSGGSDADRLMDYYSANPRGTTQGAADYLRQNRTEKLGDVYRKGGPVR